MQGQELTKLKGVAAILEYMASADKLDVRYTQEALGMLAEQLYEVVEHK